MSYVATTFTRTRPDPYLGDGFTTKHERNNPHNKYTSNEKVFKKNRVIRTATKRTETSL